MNINPNFKKILEAKGIDISTGVLQSSGKIRFGSVYREGDWSYSVSKNIAYQSTASFIAEDEKVCVDREWTLENDKLILLREDMI
mgnify:CR=1 FL=1